MTNNRMSKQAWQWRHASIRAAAAIAMALSVTAANAALPPNPNDPDYDWFGTIDLGINVSGVEKTPRGVGTFLATLEPQTRRIIVATCNRYMEQSIILHSRDALQFCRVAVDL
jgi:hypothetical protein